MNLINWNEEQFKDFDSKFAYDKDDLGVTKNNEGFLIKLWQPIAKNVEVLIFKDYLSNDFQVLNMNKKEQIWELQLSNEYQGSFYQYRITHSDDSVTIALDPYAKSMAPFNHLQQKVGKALIFDWDTTINKPQKLQPQISNNIKAIVYELQIRDFTSIYPGKLQAKNGTFNAALEANIFEHLTNLNITHLQLLPLQSTYTVNEFEQKIYLQNQGNGWNTNYNWGYDPHNYFTLNGIFSSDPLSSVQRIHEFANFINEAHKNKIGIIMDVVFNHLMHNDIFNNILPGYYFRNNAKQYPVDQPPLATQRFMVRKLIIDVLKYFVQYFNVDGFRFDLSCFFDKQTHEQIAFELRKINPNIILHGEAWPFSDLEFSSTYIKGYNDNDFEFAYFNDTLRDSITCNENNKSQKGLIIENNLEQFKRYVSSIVGNLKDYKWGDIEHSNNFYDLFANTTKINLGYVSCHDGFTLWDKIIINSKNNTFEELIEKYRKALIMLHTTQGRKLLLAGTELLQSKPCDFSGQDGNRCEVSLSKDYLNLNAEKNMVHPNTYKTTDYVNSMKWQNLNLPLVKDKVFDFISQLNAFKLETEFFNLTDLEQIQKNINFVEVNSSKGLIIFEVAVNKEKVVVMHNFSTHKHLYEQYKDMNVLFSSKLEQVSSFELLPFESKILR
ncbi:hypothetical protein [Mycoplasmopsis columboralis]|uniref:Pullulanase n=1 Tax=Mycoplasmopsis columboralis TaxID=171282 RepID=A0A449B6J1_9BACT|nr:hypothetical protein [Mycoplasmopsis columboralis]VEU76223.1 Pullulanase [Mycoplasmopsis columboralis]